MKLSEHVESALHTCVVLASGSRLGGLPVKRLAEFHDLPLASLSKQLQSLAAAGLVVGSAGRVGGYRLARPAREISVLEIVEAVDGGERGFRCREIRRRGACTGPRRRYSPRCAIASVMDAAEEAWRASLREVSLADLTHRIGSQLDDRIRRDASRWLAEHEREIP